MLHVGHYPQPHRYRDRTQERNQFAIACMPLKELAHVRQTYTERRKAKRTHTFETCMSIDILSDVNGYCLAVASLRDRDRTEKPSSTRTNWHQLLLTSGVSAHGDNVRCPHQLACFVFSKNLSRAFRFNLGSKYLCSFERHTPTNNAAGAHRLFSWGLTLSHTCTDIRHAHAPCASCVTLRLFSTHPWGV
jgi:hypothetical protein